MLNLSIKIFWHFLKNNKLLVGFLCLIQIISIFASLFVFSYFASYTNANKKYDNSKTYTVSFNGAFIDDNMMLKEIEHFNNKCDLELNAVSIKANIDDTRIMFDYLYYPNHIKHGRYFNQDEFVTNKHVIISGDEGVIEEDKISICNDKYTVIGTYSVGGYNILPISSINDVKHNNESVSIVLDKYPDDDENNKIISQLTECFENAEIIYPERIKNIDSLWNDSTTIIYIGIFLIHSSLFILHFKSSFSAFSIRSKWNSERVWFISSSILSLQRLPILPSWVWWMSLQGVKLPASISRPTVL